MSTTYGSFPGVRVVTTGGGIAGSIVGREQVAVIFGRGDPSEGAASVNTPTQIDTRVGASTQFGPDTDLADGIQGALVNGANIDYLYGVMAEETAVTGESVSGQGQLSHQPIVEDKSVCQTQSESDDVNFVYESPPATPDTGVNIKPQTGEYQTADSATFSLDYAWLDWQAALDAADKTVKIGEPGIFAPLTESHEVARMLVDKVDEDVDGNLREDYRLVKGIMGAEPNATNSFGEPEYDPASYTDNIADDAMFLAAPVRRRGSTRTIIGGLAGMWAGHALTNPVYGDGINGYGNLTQELRRTQKGELRKAKVIPVEDNVGTVDSGTAVADNLSTSEATDWQRDFHRRRIVDQVILIAREVGQNTLNRRLVDQVLELTKQNILDELTDLVEAGLLRGNPDNQENGQGGGGDGNQNQNPDQVQSERQYFVEVVRSDNPDEIKVAIGFTPVGIAKRVDNELTVS